MLNLIDIYGDREDLLIVDDHNGGLIECLDEWRKLDDEYAKTGEEPEGWTAISTWLVSHNYPPIEFEEVVL